jgi:hypothetical protein
MGGGARAGLGLAVGQVIALPAVFSESLAPDRFSPASIAVLAVWTGIVVLLFMAFPVWAGHWADAWQGTARVPARGGMVAAALAAWAIMTAGLYFLLLNFTDFLDESSAVDEWHQLPALLRGTVVMVTVQAGSPLVCLLVAGMPLAAALAHRDWRWPREPAVLLCLTGCAAAIVLTLAVSAVTHARVSESVRWGPGFLVNLANFDEQAIVVVAAGCALLVAARARTARELAASIIVAAVVAAAGAVALSNLGAVDRCFRSLSIQYANPPGGSCVTSPDAGWLRQLALGAALVSTDPSCSGGPLTFIPWQGGEFWNNTIQLCQASDPDSSCDGYVFTKRK